MVRTLTTRSKKPVLAFVDDLEKIPGDRVTHLTRSERTLRLLEELKGVFELPRLALAVSLQDEFHAKVRDVVKEGADPTVLGLFKNILHLGPLAAADLRKAVDRRLQAAGWKGTAEGFFEPEALNLALALAQGNPRRLMYLLSEALDRSHLTRARRVGYGHLFDAVNEHLKLDLVCRKLLFFLAKSGRALASNSDLQAFMGLDPVSLNRRFEILVGNRLAERADVVDGSFVYCLPGLEPPAPKEEGREGSLVRFERFKDERMWVLDAESEE
jgi:hypothetical protein